MSTAFRLSFVVSVLLWVALIAGCGGGAPRLVDETDEYSFDQLAAQAAAESERSEADE